jgi:hypothetical protein
MREVIENACGILAVAIVLVAFSALQSRHVIGNGIIASSEIYFTKQWASDRQ